jgi:lathosterol oxidase
VNKKVRMNDFLNFGTENPYREFNNLINGYFLKAFQLESTADSLTQSLGEDGGYYMRCYIRDLVMGTIVYWMTAGVWSFFEFVVFKDKLFTRKDRSLPTWDTFYDQMLLAQSSLLVYAALPVFSEFLIESGITHAYFYVSDVGGWGYYFLYFFLYLTFVEVGIYWMHRTLHTNKFLYKYVHGLHHKYNSPQTLTPWASIAFNPIDGILQASPYVVGLFFVPVHYFTHVFLLFFSGVWATNIHDALVRCRFLSFFF